MADRINEVNKSLSSPQTQFESFSTESFGFNFLFQFISELMMVKKTGCWRRHSFCNYNAFGPPINSFLFMDARITFISFLSVLTVSLMIRWWYNDNHDNHDDGGGWLQSQKPRPASCVIVKYSIWSINLILSSARQLNRFKVFQ